MNNNYQFVRGICYLDPEFKQRILARLMNEHNNINSLAILNTDKDCIDRMNDTENLIEIINEMPEHKNKDNDHR